MEISDTLVVDLVEMPEEELEPFLKSLSEDTRNWELRAARGEAPWICSSCCCGSADGMPDKCYHGLPECDNIINRNKQDAMQAGNEPF